MFLPQAESSPFCPPEIPQGGAKGEEKGQESAGSREVDARGKDEAGKSEGDGEAAGKAGILGVRMEVGDLGANSG